MLEAMIVDGRITGTPYSVSRVLEAVLTWGSIEEAARRLELTEEQVRAAMAYALACVQHIG